MGAVPPPLSLFAEYVLCCAVVRIDPNTLEQATLYYSELYHDLCPSHIIPVYLCVSLIVVHGPCTS